MANLLPYSMSYMVVYLILMAVWYFLNLPLGPGASFSYVIG